MADEVPDSAGGAVRAFLGALGFIVALIGAEMLAEKGADRIWIGLALIAASLPIFLSAFMWKWFRKKVGKLFADRLVAIANDPRWWIISFFLALFSMRLVMFGIDFPWITAGIIVILMCLIVWGYFVTRSNPIPSPAPPPSGGDIASFTGVVGPVPAAIDGQTKLDLLHLLNFAVDYTTKLTLQDLATKAPMNVKEGPLDLNTDFAASYQAASDFVRHLGGKLVGEFRRSDFRNWMIEAEREAEHQIETTPAESRPRNVDPIVLRRHAIAYLQCARAIGFMRIQVAELDEQLRNQRHQLLERLMARNK